MKRANQKRKRKRSVHDTGHNLFNSVFLKIFRFLNSKEITVQSGTDFQQKEYYKYDQAGSRGMLLVTENFLRGNLLQDLLDKSPGEVLAVLHKIRRISNDTIFLLILADICRYYAGTRSQEEKIRYDLAAIKFCHLAFSEYRKKPEAQAMRDHIHVYFMQLLQICNESLAGIFTYLKQNHLTDNSSFSICDADGQNFVFEVPVFRLSVPRESISDFSLCSSFRVNALRLINKHSGIGVPLVAKVTDQKLSQSLRTPKGLTIPVTFFPRIRPISDEKFSLTLHYQDTTVQEDFMIEEENCPGNGIWPLAKDFSTPLACFMNEVPQTNLLSGMLNSAKYDTRSALFMLEPYHPEKIPVVFIHGLMSSPATWGQMINSLKFDASIRAKYQFWFFYYATGAPVIFPANRLRKALQSARKEFCVSEEATENFNKMVLVGHSMGGLLCRMMLQEDPYGMLKTVSKKSWQEICGILSPEDLEFVKDNLVLDPLPFVKRVVFMAVPHRGSAKAKEKLAELGIRLIRLPSYISSHAGDFKRIINALCPGDRNVYWTKNNFITGIDNLDPDGLFVRWNSQAALKKDVIYHSIIGNHKEAGVPGGGDGIVPYNSSHLDGVASECIIRSGHSVHRQPAAIHELLRILLLHLEKEEKN